MTRLQSFLKAKGIKPMRLAADAGVSRQHLLRLRRGTTEPTRRVMVALATACRRITRNPVRVADLFDIGEDVSTVAVVTIEQGRTFAAAWIERARHSEAPDEAFAAARVMVWPEDNPEAQARFNAIMDDILAGFWTVVREPVAKAFVSAANHVITSRR
ncbi:MAG TPA: helix-turn-helix transcriptional regulator [Thermoanaerobaculia bacterium]|nr:helix-turn-helix transcriptional regulator [Thermoanaerobaculia bacterium]